MNESERGGFHRPVFSAFFVFVGFYLPEDFERYGVRGALNVPGRL
ncbi:hypothetical protein [Stutzerimonas kirkiae]|nr:hypothetical protein [Stutzerimonas kirkiae]